MFITISFVRIKYEYHSLFGMLGVYLTEPFVIPPGLGKEYAVSREYCGQKVSVDDLFVLDIPPQTVFMSVALGTTPGKEELRAARSVHYLTVNHEVIGCGLIGVQRTDNEITEMITKYTTIFQERQ
jgi:hypothetical protein